VKNKTTTKIVFLVPYPFAEAPSQRFRFEQYFCFLESNSVDYKVFSFYSIELWRQLYSGGNQLSKLFGLMWAFLKRPWHVLKCFSADFVFLHRELLPVGPPILEWFLTKIMRKKVIYDFDDAIWLTDEPSRLTNRLRCFWKVKYICRWAYKVSCGNEYLANYASKWNSQVIVNPTTIDTTYHVPSFHEVSSDGVLRIGWTGSHSTLKYLNQVIPVFKKFEDRIHLTVICNHNPEYDLKHFLFVPWSKENEITALTKFDVGVMPLPDDLWANGKCGFKALQYMAIQKPVILSPVGVNKKIILEGLTGFFANNQNEWEKAIEKVLGLPKERLAIMGESGRNYVLENYSVQSNQFNFLALFDL